MLRASAVALVFAGAIAAPLFALGGWGVSPVELPGRATAGLFAAIDSVGWVLVPQLFLAVGVLGLAVEQQLCRVAGRAAPDSPGWLAPAVESALLLGMLGTISGMVSGFVGLSPDELEPGPLVYSLGTALRSSFVGFLIALVGVWVQAHPGSEWDSESPEPA